MYNVEEIRYLSLENGMNDRMIADLLGCARTTITRIRKRAEIPICDKNNREDKTYVCVKCNKVVHIKRCETKRLFCPECLQSVGKDSNY